MNPLGIIGASLLLFNWMDKFVNEKELVNLPENQSDDSMSKKNPEEEIKALQAENKRLEKDWSWRNFVRRLTTR